jgi:hypothetical protein
MPRATYGPQPKKRALRLFEALLCFVNDEIEECDRIDLKCNWHSKDSATLKLIVKTKLRALEALTTKDNHSGSLTKPQIREALYRMQKFLGILEDNRVQNRGPEEWHFTLTLWSTDKAKNLLQFEQTWERNRPDKSKKQEAAQQTTAQPIKPTRPVTGVSSLVPYLPTYFVERPEAKEKLKQCLFSEATTKTGTLVVSAIYGLGGIGKSTLAAALAYDPDVQAHFPDGILWITLGQQPDLLSCLGRWIQALRDFDFKPTTIDAASMHLRTLLSDKAVLLVVDDVWNPEHVEPFRIGSEACRVLITTREAAIIGATRYDLDLMTPQQSLVLLEQCRGGQLSSSEQKQAQALAKTVGYLPLALELAAAQVADGLSWSELLGDLQREIAFLETLDLPGAQEVSSEFQRKRYSLLASFHFSLRRLDSQKLQKFAWLGVLPEDVTITPALAVTLWELNQRQARDTLRYFKSKALLLPGTPVADGTQTYRLHDLLHDMARRLLTAGAASGKEDNLPGLGLTLPEAHAILLKRYQTKTTQGLWHTLPDDGYIHTHLTWHLEQAGWVDQLHQLLQEETIDGRNGWYQACETLGLLATYVKDVARAWQLAEEAFASCPSDSIGLQSRYALIVSSLNSLAGNIPAELMAALVEKQVWTPAQGAAYAQQVQDFRGRAEAFEKLAPHLPPILLPQALEQALEAAMAIQNEYYRADALSTLAPHLPETLLKEALLAARAIQHGCSRARVLSDLAPHLPKTLLKEALLAARTIQNEYYRAVALLILALHFPETLLKEALLAAMAIQDEYYRARALSNLAPQFPGILPEALLAARAIQDEYYRADALSKLALHFPGILPEALLAARAIQHEYSRVDALSKLAPHFPEILPEALLAARAIQDESDRVDALSTLAPHLPETLLKEAFSAARAIQNEYYRADALSNLALHFPGILPEALLAARAIQDEYCRADALSNLALHFPGILPEALLAARAIQHESGRARTLSNLAPHLPEILPEALLAARTIKDEYYRALALSNLVLHLPEILPEVLLAARAIQDEYYRARALSNLFPHLPEILPEALSAARAIQDEYCRARALSNLAPHLPEILPEALSAARAIQHEYHRARALLNLAPHLPEILPEALSAARAIQHEYLCARTLSKLAPHLPEILPEALSAARAIQHEYHRARALSNLAPHLPEILPEALLVARAIQDESNRADALSNLAPHLPEILPEALLAARAIKDEYYRALALSKLAPHLPEILPEALLVARAIQHEYDRAYALSGMILPLKSSSSFDFSLWKESLRLLACRERKNLLEDITELSSVIIALGGSEALTQTARAIQEVGRQWS